LLLFSKPYLENGTLVIPSLVLKLELWLLPNGQLRFFDPQQGEFLRTYREERERGDYEQKRADILAAKLKELGIDPSDLV